MHRCMEHATHLAAKHFVEGVNPTSSGKLFEKIKTAIANATTEDAVDIDRLDDLDRLEKELSGLELDAEADDLQADEYEVADTIGKVIALITQVTHSCLCIVYQDLTFFLRFENPLKLASISINAAPMSVSASLSYSSGFGPDGRHYSRCWNGCCDCARYMFMCNL